MSKNIVTSLSNPKIKEYLKLQQKKYRDATNLFIVEGFHLVDEAKKANIIHEIITCDENNEGTLVSEEVIKKLSSTETPQPIIAICKKMKREIAGNRILYLDNIQDPGNVGTLIRTARAFSWDSIVVKGVDIYSPKVIRSSQGAFFNTNVVQVTELKKEKDDFWIGACLDKQAQIYNKINLPSKFTLILGNEGNGISNEVMKKLDLKVYIPINFESLNVAQAGAILLNQYKNI